MTIIPYLFLFVKVFVDFLWKKGQRALEAFWEAVSSVPTINKVTYAKSHIQLQADAAPQPFAAFIFSFMAPMATKQEMYQAYISCF